MIKASVKRTDVIFEDLPELNEVNGKYNNTSNLAEPVNIGPVITARIYYVKIKKVFKVRIVMDANVRIRSYSMH